MAPPLRLTSVNRSLVRIPGSGSGGGGAWPMSLNLARTLNDFSENLPAMNLFASTHSVEFPASSSSLRENLAPAGPLLFGDSWPSPPGLGNSEPTRGLETPGEEGTLLRAGKRSREVIEESEPKKRVCTSVVASGAAVARKNLAVRVSGASCVPDSPTVRSWPTGGNGASCVPDSPTVRPWPTGDNGASLGQADGEDCSRSIKKPRSVVYLLAKAIEDVQVKQEEGEKEMAELQEEVAVLRRKVATFREIFQDTNKLKAVLQRLNIKI